MLRAPFPWFGGKSRVASLVWSRFGDVRNYVEPFAGSLACLLLRPQPFKGVETVNDLDGMVANFWRALASDPEAVARHADWPVNECDLHARHLWLVNEGRRHVERLKTEHDYYDAKIAGWWVWGCCQWIGGGWCEHPERKPRPHLGDAGRGVHRPSQKLPHLGDAGMGVHRPSQKLPPAPTEQAPVGSQDRPLSVGDALKYTGRGADPDEAVEFRGYHTHPETGQKMARVIFRPKIGPPHETSVDVEHIAHADSMATKQQDGKAEPKEGDVMHFPATANGRRGFSLQVKAIDDAGMGDEPEIYGYFRLLADRLRRVRVCCGDWSRVCGPTPTVKQGLTAVFLDPPYDQTQRDANIYAVETPVSAEVRAWCLEQGGDKRLRIALCGYEGEGHEELERHGWEVVKWKARGGYGNRSNGKGAANARRERIWFSPHCLRPAAERSLFEDVR